MKIIEALKQTKEMEKKAEDLRNKVAANSARLSYETPLYADTPKQIKEWIQSHSDILKEILRLRIAIQTTNLKTSVTIEIDGKNVTKSIAEWVHRRRDLAGKEMQMWQKLTDRNLKEGIINESTGQKTPITITRCYDPAERDQAINVYQSEPVLIDSKLEIVNAVTDLIE